MEAKFTPTFIPPYLGQEIKSAAERKMYDVLQNLCLKNAYVLHSLGLPKHKTKIYGEVDFVVVCERGVACLEIKGGRVECREGKWLFTDRYGVEREKAEGPFAQVIGNMFSLKTVLKQQFPTNPHINNLLCAAGVVFPDIDFKSTSQEIISEMIFDRSTKDITSYMNRVFDYWQERGYREPAKLSPTDIEEIVKYLRGEFCFIPALGERLENVERKLIRLTAEQTRIMDALSMNPHLLISGSAGTGKTLLAADFARKQAAQGRRVLFLTYNKNLANYVSAQLDLGEKLKVINIHALFGEYVSVVAEEVTANPQNYFSEVLPERFWDYVSALPPDELAGMQYDLLIMDEGQDILRPALLYPLDYLLKGGFEKGNWAFFYDEHQNIYNPDYLEGMIQMQSYPNITLFRLFVNCRNTIQIGRYTLKKCCMELEAESFMRENGEEVERIQYSDAEDFSHQVSRLLKRLRREGVRESNIVFLSGRRYKNSLLAKAGIKVNEMGTEFEEKREMPVYSTIQGFKGLDSGVVILFGMEDIRGEDFQKYMYIAGTRARTLLFVLEEASFFDGVDSIDSTPWKVL
ncbi:MAG: NERD domain-containing protein [Clostridiales bacterium]|nr:NERD domain-containing protein [Clostridiales bacterium]